MKANEFCYWLQGLFELCSPDAVVTLSAVQVRTIRAHLNLVQRCDPTHDNLLVEWLSSFIAGNDNRLLNADDTAKVKRYLARQFKHEIDPTYEGKPAELQGIHDGGHGRPDHIVYRC